MEIERIPDHVLELAAAVLGADSTEARVLAKLQAQRAKDRQVHAFRIGQYWMICPVPDASTELIMIDAAEELAAED